MKIVTTYDFGQIFPHFGKTEFIKYYEVDEENHVVVAEVLKCKGHGHTAISQGLQALGADVLICGGIGAPARDALEQSGIRVIAGASGRADEAVEAFLKGELTSDESAIHVHSHGGGCCHS